MFNNITVLKGFFLAYIQKATDNHCILSVKVFFGFFLFANFPVGYCLFHALCFVPIRIQISSSYFHSSMFGTVEL